jgi:hypothetical protein
MVYAEPMLTRQWWKATVSLSPVLVIAALGVSCEDQGKYQGSISKVHDATAVVIASAKATYVGLNKAERDHYVELQLTQRKPIDPDELEEVQVLDAHETASRMSSLDVLAKYSDLLVQLATTQTPASVQSKTTDLQQSLVTLSGDVDKLAGTNSAQFQARTKSVLPLLGTALQAFVNAKTVAALKKATVDAIKPVNDFIGALETDMRLAHGSRAQFPIRPPQRGICALPGRSGSQSGWYKTAFGCGFYLAPGESVGNFRERELHCRTGSDEAGV